MTKTCNLNLPGKDSGIETGKTPAGCENQKDWKSVLTSVQNIGGWRGKTYTAGGGSCVLPFQIGRAGSWSITLEGWPWGYTDVICIALMSKEHWFCQVGRRRTCMQDMPWPPSHFAHWFLGCDSLDWCTHIKCKLKGSNSSSSLLWTACELSFFNKLFLTLYSALEKNKKSNR